MTDENEITATEAPAPPAPDPAIAALTAQVAALNDVVQSAITARPVAAQGGSAPNTVTPQLRQVLRQQGLSDADIEHNAPIILPFISVFAPELVGLVESRIGSVDERVTRSEMEADTDAYPYAKPLRTEIKKLLADAKKENRPFSQEAAYHTAVSMNLDKVSQVDSQRRSESAGHDAMALDTIGHRGSAATSQKSGRQPVPRTAADLKSMSREERMKFYDQYGDTPVQ